MSITAYREILGGAQSGGALACQKCGSFRIKAVPSTVAGSIFLLCQGCNTRFSSEALQIDLEEPTAQAPEPATPEPAAPEPEPEAPAPIQPVAPDPISPDSAGSSTPEPDAVEPGAVEPDAVEPESATPSVDVNDGGANQDDHVVPAGSERHGGASGGSDGALQADKEHRHMTAEPSIVHLLNAEDLDTARVQTFYRQIGSIMRDNLNQRHVGGKRSGHLDGRRLYKVLAGTDRVFTKAEARRNRGYNVVLVVDCSASMRDEIPGGQSRITVAAEAARMLVKGLIRHNINVAVVAHSDRGVAVMKDWKTNPQFDVDRMYYSLRTWVAGNNQDYAALRKAEELLDQRRGDGHQDIVVVICDGELYIDRKTFHDKKLGRTVDAVLGHCYRPDVHNGEPYGLKGKHARAGAVGAFIPENFRLLQLCQDLRRRATFITISIDCKEALHYYPNVHLVRSRDGFITTIMSELRRSITRG